MIVVICRQTDAAWIHDQASIRKRHLTLQVGVPAEEDVIEEQECRGQRCQPGKLVGAHSLGGVAIGWAHALSRIRPVKPFAASHYSMSPRPFW